MIPWVTIILFVVDLLIRVGLSVRVIMRRLPVGVATAWLVIVLVFPFAGALVYLLIGELRLGRRRAERAEKLVAEYGPWLEQLRARTAFDWPKQTDGVRALGRLTETLWGITPVPFNRVELLDDFDQTIDRLIADIDGATVLCEMEFYIWSDGGRADDVAAALARAAQRGLTCRLLVDDVGSRPFLRGASAAKLRTAGVQVRPALPTNSLKMFFVRFDLRLHRKVVVIDDRIAYTGSLNMADPRFFKQDAGVGTWIDAMVRIEGSATKTLSLLCNYDWILETGDELDVPQLGEAARQAGTATIQLIPSGPGQPPRAMERVLLTAVYTARREIVLTTPYFVPDTPLLSALLSAAERGVDVTLVVPKHVDSILVRWASRAFQADLHAAGVHVAHFTGGLLHTKSIAIDGEISLFGSLNLDPRSLNLNFEITLAIYDAEFTARLRALQETYLESSERLDPQTWNERGNGARFLENAARLMGPLL